MAKKITKKIKVQVQGGKASPAGTLGPALGQAGVNIGQFVNEFNEKTRGMMGEIVPVEITVYEDRTFTFITKTPPAAFLILKAANIEKGSGATPVTKVGSITKAQAREIAERKMENLNAHDVDAASRIIEGTARSMGIDVK